jgi:hypothetical protein
VTRKILATLAAVLLIIQFIRPEVNSGESGASGFPSHEYPVSPELGLVLRQSCYDCHSNRTTYPWYAYVQPVAWWLESHIMEGKEHLNFDELVRYRPARRFHKFEEIEEMVVKGEMPLESYTIIHRDAILTDETADMIVQWTKAMRDSMNVRYPADSLRRR